MEILKQYPKIKRKKGMFYYFDKSGRLVERNPKTKRKSLVKGASRIIREKGYFYYLSSSGYYARSKRKGAK